MLEKLLKDLLPKAKITVEQPGINKDEPVEMLVNEYVLIARTPTGEVVLGNCGPTFLNGAAIHILKQALKAEDHLLEKSAEVCEGLAVDHKCDCSTCDAAKVCPGAKLSK